MIIAPPFRIRPFSPVPVPDVIISNTYRHSWVMRASWLFAASSVTLSPDLPRPICGGALALPLSCCSSVCSFCTCWAIKGLLLEKRPQSGEMPDSPRKKSGIWEGGLGSALFFVRAWDQIELLSCKYGIIKNPKDGHKKCFWAVPFFGTLD